MNLEATPGEAVFNTAIRAIQEANYSGIGIKMTHNDVSVSVYPESYLHDILEKYQYARELVRKENR